jgi:hypothetical protein
MPRTFLTLTADDRDDALADAISSRERELASYDANIENYTSQLESLAALPVEWPEELVRFRGKQNEQLLAMGATEAQAAAASPLNHRDRLRLLLTTENAECRKSELAYDSLLGLLPVGVRRDAAMARVKAKSDAAAAKQ